MGNFTTNFFNGIVWTCFIGFWIIAILYLVKESFHGIAGLF